MPSVSFSDVDEDDVIMITEEAPLWRNCLMQVEQVRSWGVSGTVFCPHEEEYPLRVGWDEIAAVYRKVTTGG